MIKIEKKSRGVVAGVTVVFGLVLLALFFPKIIMKVSDEETENQISGFYTEIKTYDNGFTNFYEELKCMSDEEVWRDGLKKVYINENGGQVTDEDLSEAVNHGLKRLQGCNMLKTAYVVRKESLKSRRLLSLYSEDKENKLNGVRMWDLTYETDTYRMDLLMDVDYNVICTFRLTLHIATSDDIRKEYLLTDDYRDQVDNASKDRWWKERLEAYYELTQKDIYCVTHQAGAIAIQGNKANRNNHLLVEEYGYYTTKVLMTYYNVAISPGDKETLQFGLYNVYKMMQ